MSRAVVRNVVVGMSSKKFSSRTKAAATIKAGDHLTCSQQQVTSTRLQQSQADVDETLDLLQSNIQNLLERGETTSSINQRAEYQNEGAMQFKTNGISVNRKTWWENIELWITFRIVILTIIVIVILSVTIIVKLCRN